MGLVRTVDPTIDPVTVEEAKAQIGIASAITAYDDQVATIVAAAVDWFEQETRRAYITQTWKLILSGFPAGDEQILLPRPPLQSITSVYYVDTAGDSQELDSSKYLARTNSNPGCLALAYNQSWPSTHSEEPEAVTITYVAGYGATADTLPVLAKHGLLLLVDFWWKNRGGDNAQAVPPQARAIAKRLHCGMKLGSYGVTV